MLETVGNTMAARALGAETRTLILAVSGGADSMAMLHALVALREPLALKLRVAHVHHGLRGRSASADARLVERTAVKLGLPFHLHRADVRALAKRRKLSVEMAARDVRHAFFARLARRYRAVVATAHTLDDQAETVLLRILRGSGTDGLGGIDYASEVRGLPLIRPLLDVRHADAVAFLRARKLEWREDASNDDEAMVRNRVRRSLLPLLERDYNPRIREALARTASVLRADACCLSRMAEHELAKRLDAAGALRLTGRLDPAIRRRVLYLWLLRHAGVTVDRLDNELVRRVELLAEQGGKITLPGAIQVHAVRRQLAVERVDRK